jgi:hypothetical protein
VFATLSESGGNYTDKRTEGKSIFQQRAKCWSSEIEQLAQFASVAWIKRAHALSLD